MAIANETLVLRMFDCNRLNADSRKLDVDPAWESGSAGGHRHSRNGPLRILLIERGGKPASVHLDRTQMGCGGPASVLAMIVTDGTTHKFPGGHLHSQVCVR